MYPSKLLTVLVSGKAGVGKTTFSRMAIAEIERLGYKGNIFPFARSVKSLAAALGWDRAKDDRGRALLQGLGSVGREYDPDMWVKQSFLTNLPYMQTTYQYALVDDWRFPNEYAKLKDNPALEVFTVRIESQEREALMGTPYYNDVSETSLPTYNCLDGLNLYQHVVHNTGSLEDLNVKAQNVVQYILTHCKKWE